MAVNSTQEGGDSYSDVAFPHEGNNIPHCELPVALLNSMEVYVPLKNQFSLDDLTNSQNFIKKAVETAAAYSECTEKDVDIEKGKLETPKINEETICNLKNEEGHMKSLQKQIIFEMGSIIPKFYTRGEKVLEFPRMRKYKRTASFNSRKVALMFSVLSSLGTIILIYLTLRVKQIADASTHSE